MAQLNKFLWPRLSLKSLVSYITCNQTCNENKLPWKKRSSVFFSNHIFPKWLGASSHNWIGAALFAENEIKSKLKTFLMWYHASMMVICMPKISSAAGVLDGNKDEGLFVLLSTTSCLVFCLAFCGLLAVPSTGGQKWVLLPSATVYCLHIIYCLN